MSGMGEFRKSFKDYQTGAHDRRYSYPRIWVTRPVIPLHLITWVSEDRKSSGGIGKRPKGEQAKLLIVDVGILKLSL
jgi:hypothetical protein